MIPLRRRASLAVVVDGRATEDGDPGAGMAGRAATNFWRVGQCLPA